MKDFSMARRQLMLNSAAWIGGGIVALAAAKPAGAAMQRFDLSSFEFVGHRRCKSLRPFE